MGHAMIPHEAVLRRIAAALDGAPIEWVVTGSLGLVLRGLDVTVRDIDLQTDREGAYAIAARLAGGAEDASESDSPAAPRPIARVVEPVAPRDSGWIRSHFGALEVDSVRV